MKFPEHKGGLSISHNDHKASYCSIEDWLDFLDEKGHLESFKDKQDYLDCIENDSLWQVQWYPDTPIGSYSVFGSTFEIALDLALEIENSYRH